MKLTIKHQESYSRGELLLRSFFGVIYIFIPHFFLLLFYSIAQSVLLFIAWWAILFTGRHPKSFFDFQVGMLRWGVRLNATMSNLVDGYPAFGIKENDDKIILDVPYPETMSRGTLLLRSFFGVIYCLIPHGFILMFRGIWASILGFVAWWVILFTGRFPESWHTFIVGNLRWSTRVNVYMNMLSDQYPPFSSRE